MLSRARVRLPATLESSTDESEPPSYDICLVISSSGALHGSVPLTASGEEGSYKAARPLKGKRDSELTIEIRGRGGARLFATPPLFAIELLKASKAAAAEARANGEAVADEMEADAEKLAKRTLAVSSMVPTCDLCPCPSLLACCIEGCSPLRVARSNLASHRAAQER